MVTRISAAIIRKWEGCGKAMGDGRFIAYWDAIGGVWTIGWGTTGNDVFRGVIWTQAQCDERNLSVIANLVEHVSRMVTHPINDYQMACLVSLAYNTGLDQKADGHVSSFGIDSTLLKLVNAGRLEDAADEFLKWCYGRDPQTRRKVKIRGLYNRRVYERDVFLGRVVPGPVT